MSNPRKNYPALVKAFEQYRTKGGRCHLGVTGSVESIKQQSGDVLAKGIHPLGYVDEATLKRLYQNCAGLVYPSLDEGFGIPLVDAARFSKPVACSNIDVFREVMGDYPIYFNPMDVESITQALFHLEQNLVPAATRLPPRNYDWQESAQKLLGVLKDASR
jgi:glycosyltransferase involved in cell wall biosynthesis